MHPKIRIQSHYANNIDAIFVNQNELIDRNETLKKVWKIENVNSDKLFTPESK